MEKSQSVDVPGVLFNSFTQEMIRKPGLQRMEEQALEEDAPLAKQINNAPKSASRFHFSRLDIVNPEVV